MREFRSSLTLLMFLAILTGSLAAQSMPRASVPRPIVDGLLNLLTGIETTVMATAEDTPESLYPFKPTPDVRSFGQILAHIADAQKALCEGTHGSNVNLTDSIEKSATTKPAIIAALKDTFAACRTIMSGLSDADAARLVPFGRDPASISTILAFTISHGNEHYGNQVTYMRLNGIVPPSSRSGR